MCSTDVRITAMKKRTALVGAASAAVLAVLPLVSIASAAEYTVTYTSGPHTGDKCTWANSCRRLGVLRP